MRTILLKFRVAELSKFRHKGSPLFISEIQLKNYRNYEKLELSFEDKVNVIIGENAQGKQI